MFENIAFVDLEISIKTNKVLDYGVITSDKRNYHGSDSNTFKSIIKDYDFLCGHNIINFDSKYIDKLFVFKQFKYIDTLFSSPIIYPTKIYHNLLKDDKLCSEDINNPLNDSKNAEVLFYK